MISIASSQTFAQHIPSCKSRPLLPPSDTVTPPVVRPPQAAAPCAAPSARPRHGPRSQGGSRVPGSTSLPSPAWRTRGGRGGLVKPLGTPGGTLWNARSDAGRGSTPTNPWIRSFRLKGTGTSKKREEDLQDLRGPKRLFQDSSKTLRVPDRRRDLQARLRMSGFPVASLQKTALGD